MSSQNAWLRRAALGVGTAALVVLAAACGHKQTPAPAVPPRNVQVPEQQKPPAGNFQREDEENPLEEEAPPHSQVQPLQDRVRSALARDPRLDASHVRVRASGHTVFLDGLVPSEQQRRLAMDIAHSVAGVQEVSVANLQVG